MDRLTDRPTALVCFKVIANNVLSSFMPGYYFGTLMHFTRENKDMLIISVSTTTHLYDMALSLSRSGPKSVVKKVIFQGTSLVCFLSSESTETSDLLGQSNRVGKPYALIGHVRFDEGEATRVVSLLYYASR